MQYVVYVDNNNNELYMKAHLVLEGVQAYIGFGINPLESVIGIPQQQQEEGSVQKYTMDLYTLQGIQPFPFDGQTLNDIFIEQNDTTTALQ